MAKRRKKPGPKPIPKARKRNHGLLIRFRKDERDALDAYAAERGITITDLVRDSALERISAPLDT